ncbi:tetratricopeptide repeat protein, partial [Nocardiopsis aegyptia]|uniref:tetratricopeptide repeat protein n=1 Tax=Nocardiopsis aegyptia TaxID=220378 RepID=UPI00367154E6
MPKKKAKKKPRPRVRIGQPQAEAARDVIGIKNTYVYADAASEGAASLAAVLPPVDPGFTGREGDLERLLAALDPLDASGAGTVVASGLGGIGKTELVLAAAHQAKKQHGFSEQLFLDLRGYTNPVNAHRAQQSLLESLGVEAKHIPEDPDARAGLYRATLAAKAQEKGGPVLILADNASHPEQILPLAPGPGGHRVLVTSRERLGSLPARSLNVGVLDDAEAFRVLVTDLRLANPDDERAHDLQGLTRVAEACAGLPLALRIAAGQLKNAPDMEPDELAHTLATATDRIAHFQDHRALHAVFDSSFERLPTDQADLFTLLGMAPGPDICTSAAAVLTGVDEREVLSRLRGLAASHLVTGARGRWGMHDLVAAYAASLAGARPASRFTRARRRLFDYYTNQATDAAQHLEALPGETVPDTFARREEALEWLDAQRAVLINTARLAHSTGHTRATIVLPINLGGYLIQRRLFHDQITITQLALETAHRINDRKAKAAAWNNLGLALREVRRFEEAIDAHTRARQTYQQLGDAHSEATAWNNLGLALHEVRRFEEAIDAHTRARQTYQQIGDTRNEATAWGNLGSVLLEVRRFEEAINAHTRARQTYQQIGDTRNEATAWGNLGSALREVRRFEEAIDAHRHDLNYCQQVGDAHNEAKAWNNLGLALREVRRFEEAIDAHRHDLNYCQQVGDAHNEAKAWT